MLIMSKGLRCVSFYNNPGISSEKLDLKVVGQLVTIKSEQHTFFFDEIDFKHVFDVKDSNLVG